MRFWTALVLLFLPALRAHAQSWSETFADGDLSSNPVWSGETAYWRLTPAGPDWALASAGPEASDTLSIETRSSVAYGAWTFTAGYTGGPLSNFNLARIYLTSEAEGALHEAVGFYIQIGSNERDLRLYHNTPAGRTLLGQSAADVLNAAEVEGTLRVLRRPGTGWEVMLDDSLLFTASDIQNPSSRPARFGVWVKHTRTRAGDFRFDDIVVEAGDDADPDTTSPPPPIPPGALVINEIHFAPSPAENEFVEILNRSDAPVDLRSLSLADNRDEPVPVTTHEIRLAPGAMAVFVRDADVFEAAFPGREPLAVANWPSLNNDADDVRLRSGSALLDAVSYRADWGVAGASLERRDPAGPSDYRGNWGTSVAPARATPGQRNTLFAPDTEPPELLLAEQQSETTVVIFWDESLTEQSLSPARFRIDERQPERVEPLDPATLRLHFAASIDGERLHATDIGDRAGNTRVALEAPVALVPSTGDLAINELLYEPRADPFDSRPDQPEYLELVNRSGRWLSLRGLRLVGREDEQGEADTLRHEAPLPVAPPGGFAVWFAVQGGDLAGAFPGLPDIEAVAWLPVNSASLGLGNAGDQVRLVHAEGAIDAVTYRPEWHHPLLAERRGIALERRWPDAPADESASWSSSVSSDGGTPGRANSVWQDPDIGLPAPESPGNKMAIQPAVFSPDGDGRDDVCLIRVRVAEAPAIVRTRIFNTDGRLIRTLAEAHFSGFEYTATWDGRDDAGERVPIGRYIVLVDAFLEAQKTSRSYKKTVVVAALLSP
ncbi:MAG: lamin tail domain-containing protein [Rhodothermales bacterium]|nr:lamin tail domain-containing protein [Rhodothermales bacterium]